MQPHTPTPASRLKHCFLTGGVSFGAGTEYAPRLYFEAKIDFADVRSGLRETCSVCSAVDMFPLDEGVLWTEDMVRPVDPAQIHSEPPREAKFHAIPDFLDAQAVALAETQYLHFLLRYFKVRIYRNFTLNVYSGPAESLSDFTVRCRELLRESFRKELDRLQEVFVRSIEQIRGKYLKTSRWEEYDSPSRSLQLKDIVHQSLDRIAQLFLQAELDLGSCSPAPACRCAARLELEERLCSLEEDAYRAIGRLVATWQDRVRNIDEYIVRPNLKDIHLARTRILWVPDGRSR